MSISAIEKKWQKIWESNQAFCAKENSKKPKYYILEMFPYPSGRMHVGHLKNYAIGDVIARFKKSQGFEVLHPMGWDAFGLPAENAAISNKTHPAIWTENNIKAMREQIKVCGFSYDWSREINTSSPDYYKHEQQFFIKLLKAGIAYQKESLVNWDPVDQTVLANEQVVNGRGWRSGAIVEHKYLKQWFLNISKYSDELLDELANLNEWPASVRNMQEKWIGRSEGANILYRIKGYDDILEVFSTTPEAIYGATFIAVAYNHPIVKKYLTGMPEIEAFVKECSQGSIATSDIEKDKKGIKTKLEAICPLNPSNILPIYITNFVSMDYGTGAIFGCPAHDHKDFDFAKAYNIPLKQVIKNDAYNIDITKSAYTDNGYMIESGILNGFSREEAKEKAISELEKNKVGHRKVNYRLKDWGISRQRFWGCPIPVIYCDTCGVVPVPEAQLPVALPNDVSFEKPGNPLDHHPTWKYTTCPNCAKPALRETDTFDTFMESSWYFARFCSPHDENIVDEEAANYWMPVDCYIGGIEHAILHLMYARFFTKLMNEFGYLKVREPFKAMIAQGMVLHATYQDKQGNWLYPEEVIKSDNKFIHQDTKEEVVLGKIEKMSKSKKNVIDLDRIIKAFGADSARLFILSDSPPEKDNEWSQEGIEACSKFVQKFFNFAKEVNDFPSLPGNLETMNKLSKNLLTMAHITIKNVTEDIENTKLNKAIARLRELFNLVLSAINDNEIERSIVKFSYQALVQLFNPFMPHITEEIWEKISGSGLALYNSPWPRYDERYIVVSTYTMAIQVSGKMRGIYEFGNTASEEEIKNLVLGLEFVKKYIENKPIKKIIIVPKKIINIVV